MPSSVQLRVRPHQVETRWMFQLRKISFTQEDFKKKNVIFPADLFHLLYLNDALTGTKMLKVVYSSQKCPMWVEDSAHPLFFGSDDELLVLLRHHAAGAVGGLQHVDHQVVGQHIQLLHVVPRHVHWARQAMPAWSSQSAALVPHKHKRRKLLPQYVFSLWTLVMLFGFGQWWFVSGYVTSACVHLTKWGFILWELAGSQQFLSF